VRKADNLTTILCRCHVIWELPGTSGPLQAWNGTDLPFTVLDNAGSITESAKSEAKLFVLQYYHSSIGMNPTQKLWL